MTFDVTCPVRARLQRGDRSALAEAFASEHARLWHLAHFRMDPRLAARIDPEDILQEAFLAAESRIDHFLNSKVSLMVWMRSIVMQTMVDLYRHHVGAQVRNASMEVSLDNYSTGHDTSTCLAAALSGGVTSPSQAAIRNEAEASLHRSLHQLDERDREIIALRHFELLSNSEVAEVLGIHPKNASIRYVRAMTCLKKILEHAEKSMNQKVAYPSKGCV